MLMKINDKLQYRKTSMMVCNTKGQGFFQYRVQPSRAPP
jgi:hypothetical protein